MGAQIPADALERSALGQVTPNPAPDPFAQQSATSMEQSLPDGDALRQVDEFGGNVPGPDPPAGTKAPTGNDISGGDMPAATLDMIRAGQTANTQRSQELAQEKQRLDQQIVQFNAERAAFSQQPAPAQEPGLTSRPTLSEELARSSPGFKETLTADNIAVLDAIGMRVDERQDMKDGRMAKLEETVVSMEQQLQVSQENSRVQSLNDEANDLVAQYGAETVRSFGTQMVERMKRAPGLGLKDAFQLAAAPQLMQHAANQALQNAAKEQKRQQEASIFEQAASPSAQPVDHYKPGETMEETTKRWGLI